MPINGGWTKTPNKIYETIPDMSTPELLCTLILVRHTYGYHRRRVRLTYTNFMRATGIRSRSTIARALRQVETRGFFQRSSADFSVWHIAPPTPPHKEPHHE
jgi:hypothetical protein